MLKLTNTTGLIAAPFAPMLEDGSLNTAMVSKYYDFLEKNGVKGAFINGTTGEGASLSQKEKRIITESWAKISGERKSIRIINLIGGTSYQECIENAIHSYESGVYAVAIVAPYYFKPDHISQLADFCAVVGESVPRLPFYFYHIPSITGVDFPMLDLLRILSGVLPNFAGIKYTKVDFMDYQSCLNFENGKYDLFWGSDECMLPALAVGAKGFVGSTYNYAAPLYTKLIYAFNNGDLEEARILQQKSINMVRLLDKYGGIATGKAFMRYIGLECGQFRSPVSNMSTDMFGKFENEVSELNINDLFSKI
jgi:N-acetylneuraminate lyase